MWMGNGGGGLPFWGTSRELQCGFSGVFFPVVLHGNGATCLSVFP